MWDKNSKMLVVFAGIVSSLFLFFNSVSSFLDLLLWYVGGLGMFFIVVLFVFIKNKKEVV